MSLTRLIKPIIFSGLYAFKFFDLLRLLQKKRVTILMYHRFSCNPEPFKVQQNIFENQIKFLIRKGYNFISLKHFSDVINRRNEKLPDNAIIVTIDDGYWDNYTFAYPVLKKYAIPATIFVVTDFITQKIWLWSNKLEYILKKTQEKKFKFPLGNTTEEFLVDTFPNWHKSQLKIFNYCSEISDDQKNDLLHELALYLKVNVPDQTVGDFQPLTWEQIKEMNSNRIDFGSHTCSHPILSRLTIEKLKHEIIDSKKEIERKVGVEVCSFCYPNGQFEDINKDVIRVLTQSGYDCAVTTVNGYNKISNANRFLLRRMSVHSQMNMYLSKEVTWSFQLFKSK